MSKGKKRLVEDMRPVVPTSRRVERAGILAVQSLFESSGCVFQEVSQQNDYGKDAYVDLVDGAEVSSICVALQIKAGRSYRTRDGDYYIPTGRHTETWRESTIPVFGVVYDPDDVGLRWVDLTAYLRSHEVMNGRVPISAKAILDASTLFSDFGLAAKSYMVGGNEGIALRLLSSCEVAQCEAIIDGWALARNDPRFLILVRRLISHFSRGALRRAIWAMAHVTPHPDIIWTKESWIEEPNRGLICATFSWSIDEIGHLFGAVDDDEWGRGTLGQSLDMILRQDPSIEEKLASAVRALTGRGYQKEVTPLVYVALSLSTDPSNTLDNLARSCGVRTDSGVMGEVAAQLKQSNCFDLY
ncbi:MAG TPA: DUF4365 domain-containing protein [Arenimonas sp.]|uniref:DUF4365 domain-containing protein n=1 Tax=Arenimonas sp. TaxID=1872635 RepID=UPI002D7FC032|nr:DUF4365 domain-containing protein [Arenimonas sp.]HEU0153457.1 DUF4365 domain-containing protein [Arenimonas sp.]